MKNMLAVSSWSGGKDSCLALYKAMNNGYRITRLVNFISKEYKRCCFHGIEARLIRLQAESIGIPLVQKEVTADMQEYEKEFKEAVSQLEGVDAMVFGDIYLDEHKDWVDRVCGELGIKPVEPLWNSPAKDLVEEFIDLGFKAVIVSCHADKLGKDFVGKIIDRDVVAEIIDKNICPCGENGEFHTFVVDGPIFKKRIEVLEGEAILKEGFWKYWFLDIKKFEVRDKE